MTHLLPGRCRYCSCTEDNACRLADNEPCAWWDEERTVCSNPRCIRAELARTRQSAAPPRPRSKYAGWGYGAILEDLRRQRRRRRGRRAA